jgi:hypothetical protein
MNRSTRALTSLSALAFAVAAAGCGGSQSAAPTLPQIQSPQSAQQTVFGDESMSFDAKSSKKTEPIHSGGGTLTLPAFGGYSGSLGYPKNNAPKRTKIALETSTTNIHNAPTPGGKKKVLMFEQATVKGSASQITFGGGSAGGTLDGPGIVTTHTYALYAYALGIQVPGFPVQLGSPTSNGTISFSSPLSGQSVPTGIGVTFELVQN